MQVFDENGNFLDMWPTGHESAVLTHYVTADDYIWVADWTTDRLIKYDLDGRYILDMGEHGPLPGQFDGVHQIHVDQEGNLGQPNLAGLSAVPTQEKPLTEIGVVVGTVQYMAPEQLEAS